MSTLQLIFWPCQSVETLAAIYVRLAKWLRIIPSGVQNWFSAKTKSDKTCSEKEDWLAYTWRLFTQQVCTMAERENLHQTTRPTTYSRLEIEQSQSGL